FTKCTKKNLDGKVEEGKLALREVVITPPTSPRQGKNSGLRGGARRSRSPKGPPPGPMRARVVSEERHALFGEFTAPRRAPRRRGCADGPRPAAPPARGEPERRRPRLSPLRAPRVQPRPGQVPAGPCPSRRRRGHRPVGLLELLPRRPPGALRRAARR